MRWLTNLAVWYLSRKLKVPYGTWLIVPQGMLWRVIEKKPGDSSDPLQRLHTVAIKVEQGQ